ncbi:25774_t:CDS:2, partial [Gigaspora rosea]
KNGMDAEKVKMEIDTIKIEIDVDAENVIVDGDKYIKVNNISPMQNTDTYLH